ncbi:MAG TPA: hypothetical protein VGB79_13795 [Allosphingosinicella sp.]|jgi:hypothetical protein
MNGEAIASQALSEGGLRTLASEIRGPRPAATAAASDTEAERRSAAPARDGESRASRP